MLLVLLQNIHSKSEFQIDSCLNTRLKIVNIRLKLYHILCLSIIITYNAYGLYCYTITFLNVTYLK